jgi:hypothetical protein
VSTGPNLSSPFEAKIDIIVTLPYEWTMSKNLQSINIYTCMYWNPKNVLGL